MTTLKETKKLTQSDSPESFNQHFRIVEFNNKMDTETVTISQLTTINKLKKCFVRTMIEIYRSVGKIKQAQILKAAEVLEEIKSSL